MFREGVLIVIFKEHLKDSKKDVDRRLKLICEQFIADTSSNILSSIMNLNSRVTTFLTMRGDKSAKLSTQPWADTNTTKGCVADTVRKIKQMVPLVQRKMQLYLANRETEFILFRPVSRVVNVNIGHSSERKVK